MFNFTVNNFIPNFSGGDLFKSKKIHIKLTICQLLDSMLYKKH